MQNKIKYVLNGETKYYTKEELKEYYTKLLKNSGVYFENDIDNDVQLLIERLKKYDGDPYGYITDHESKISSHKMEASGFLFVIR